MRIYYMLLSFFVYGFWGWCTEVIFAAVRQRKFVNRGFLNGPICPIYGIGVTLVVDLLEPLTENGIFLYLGSVLLVTLLEWLTGFLLEKLFHHKWWDYSNMPLNIQGYVCVPFSFIWGIVCVIIVRYVDPVVNKVLVWLPHWAGLLILFAGIMVLIADVYVTVTDILKLNRRLKKMEEIADELHRASEQIGGNLSKNVIEGMEHQEKLKERYQKLLKEKSLTNRRMLKAFPKMKPTRHEEQFQILKEHFLKSKRKNSKHTEEEKE